MESNFGRDKGQMKVMRSLATLLYSGNRKDYAREQYIAALKILKTGIVSPQNFTGSWAGAMGHTQFIPTSYLSFAVDWTGDGKKDIWNSKADALASTANYLAKAGWKNDRPWGWEVKLPAKFNRALIGRSNWRTVAEWSKLGIKPARGGSFRRARCRCLRHGAARRRRADLPRHAQFHGDHGLQPVAFLCGRRRPSGRPHQGRRALRHAVAQCRL